MIEKITNILNEASQFVAKTNNDIEAFRLKYLSKKGILNQLFEDFKLLQPDQKRQTGQKLNDLKEFLNSKYNDIRSNFLEIKEISSKHDLSLPGDSFELGSRHPISCVKNELNEIFGRLGFTVTEGPEIEDDWHVFSALNFPFDHPARDMQDTFFITKEHEILLRTHTSSVQVRVMEKSKLPIRVVMPGRVFRNEAISSRSHCFFHQIEGLYIDKNVSFADLKQTLLFFAKEFFWFRYTNQNETFLFPFY